MMNVMGVYPLNIVNVNMKEYTDMTCDICKEEIKQDDEYAVSNDECYICNNCYMENEE